MTDLNRTTYNTRDELERIDKVISDMFKKLAEMEDSQRKTTIIEDNKSSDTNNNNLKNKIDYTIEKSIEETRDSLNNYGVISISYGEVNAESSLEDGKETLMSLYKEDKPLVIDYDDSAVVFALTQRLKREKEYYNSFLNMAQERIINNNDSYDINNYSISIYQEPTKEITK